MSNGFPDIKVVAEKLSKIEELKKYKKKMMPFVAYLKVPAFILPYVLGKIKNLYLP
jgi:hypothetical protein